MFACSPFGMDYHLHESDSLANHLDVLDRHEPGLSAKCLEALSLHEAPIWLLTTNFRNSL